MKSFLIRYRYPILNLVVFLAYFPFVFGFASLLITDYLPIIELGFSDSIAAGMSLVLFPLYLFIWFTFGIVSLRLFFKIRKSSAAADDNKSQSNVKE